MIYWRKRAENGRKDFLNFFGRTRKSIQFGKLDQKSLFFIWFFIDNGQKTYEKIRKNWIQMRPDNVQGALTAQGQIMARAQAP